MTIADKLTNIANTKTAIKNAIINKGVAVPNGTLFSDYPNKISQIVVGSATLPVFSGQASLTQSVPTISVSATLG